MRITWKLYKQLHGEFYVNPDSYYEPTLSDIINLLKNNMFGQPGEFFAGKYMTKYRGHINGIYKNKVLIGIYGPHDWNTDKNTIYITVYKNSDFTKQEITYKYNKKTQKISKRTILTGFWEWVSRYD